MNASIDRLKNELSKISTGKASPKMLADLMVEYYGSPTPLSQVANLGTSDARTLTIQPWEKNMLGPIEKSIFEANLGLTPMNNGDQVIINVPMLTEERRKEYVKRAKGYGEDAKVSIRNVRKTMMDAIKKGVKDGVSEDIGKDFEGTVQKITNGFSGQIDEIVSGKEKELMTV